MFYYYGRKKQIARHYPRPYYNTIVEPFAGSAAYSLYEDNWRRNVILIERDERVARIWNWLIHEATTDDIQNLPDLIIGEKSSLFLHILHAATKMAFYYRTIKATPVLVRNWGISKRHMAANLYKIKHWTILHGDYSLAPDIEATWFIDPPYKEASGTGYQYGSRELDYQKLAHWVKSRRGEVICCEGDHGDYLPFVPLLDLKGVAGKSSKEAIYYRRDWEDPQMNLFESL